MKKKRVIFWSIVALLFVTALIRQQVTINKLNREYKSYNEQLAKLEIQSAQLTELLKQSESDTYVEKMAREKLGLAKTGEMIFKIKK